MKNLAILLAFFTLISINNSFSQVWIRDIKLERHDVFDSSEVRKIPGAGIINALHIKTKPYVIEDELLFKEGDKINLPLIEETERNLRDMNLFTDVRIEFDSVDPGLYDVYVVTKDRWSTMPAVLFGTGGGEQSYGARIEEYNFLGTGNYFLVEGLYRSENDIRWQGEFETRIRRIFRSDYNINFFLQANRFRTNQQLMMQKPYRTLSTKYAYGVQGVNNFGEDFLYVSKDSFELMPFHERMAKAWFSRGWMREDRVFATGYLALSETDRGRPEFQRAFDNSGRFLMSFSSVSQDFVKATKLNTYQTEDLPVGGWGNAVLGKIFPIGSKGENLYYVAGQGELSYLNDRIYLFGQLTGASAFKQAQGQYTYEEFLGLGFLRFSEDFLLAGRIRQQTVWNWPRLRQLVLDNETGLRGYELNQLAGDNRIIGNLEFRAFPDIKILILNISAAAFYDFGTVWDQDTDLTDTRWHNSVGFGLRFHNMISTGDDSILRIDFAYNFDENRFGSIIFTTDQLFSIFKKHEYRLPEIYGLEFDYD